MQNALKIKLWLYGLLWICVSGLAADATPWWNPQVERLTLTVKNIPAEASSVYIPLEVSDQGISFQQIDFGDDLLQGYISTVHKDKQDQILGISFASVRANASLPSELNVNLQVRTQQRQPQTVQIRWQKPFVYSRVLERVPGAFAGLEQVILASADFSEQRAAVDDAMYIKFLGQTLNRERRRESTLLNPQVPEGSSSLRRVTLLLYLPADHQLSEVYIPIIISGDPTLQIEALNVEWENQIAVKASPTLLHVLSVQPGELLPAGTALHLNLEIQDEQRLNNSIYVGEVCREPTELWPTVEVELAPQELQFNQPVRIKDIFAVD